MAKATGQDNKAPTIGKALSRREFLQRLAFAGVGAFALGVGLGKAMVAYTGVRKHHELERIAAVRVRGLINGGYPDALTHSALDGLNNFIKWLGANQGYVGEIGVPSNLGPERSPFYPDQKHWRALGEAWFARADASRLWVTMHDCSESQLWGGYYASLYVSKGDGKTRAISRPTYQSALLEAHATTPDYMRGVHCTGGDKFEEGRHHNKNPGVFNADYWYPGIARDANTGLNTFEYLVTRRIRLVRLPFRWERIQPTLNGALSTSELQRYKASVRSAGAAGLKVVVDCHNYGGYCTSTGRKVLNTEALPISAFVDLWRRLSEAFEDDPAVVAYDLMNEPYTHGGINAGRHPSPAKAWESAAQKAVNIVRARGETKKIMVPTYGPVPEVADSHVRPWIAGGNIAYTAHHYFDHWFGPDTGGGNYVLSYDDENAYYASRGY